MKLAEILSKATDDEIARWWVKLNCFEWPEDMSWPEDMQMIFRAVNAESFRRKLDGLVNEHWGKRIGKPSKVELRP